MYVKFQTHTKLNKETLTTFSKPMSLIFYALILDMEPLENILYSTHHHLHLYQSPPQAQVGTPLNNLQPWQTA